MGVGHVFPESGFDVYKSCFFTFYNLHARVPALGNPPCFYFTQYSLRVPLNREASAESENKSFSHSFYMDVTVVPI